jgi:hypothetical protein
MSHPVTKKRIFWVRVMERFGFGAEDSELEDSGSAAIRKQGTIAEVPLFGGQEKLLTAEIAKELPQNSRRNQSQKT